MEKEQFNNITYIKDLPNFPYGSFDEIKGLHINNQLSIGAAMDKAREWAMSGHSSKSLYLLLTFLASLYFLLPLGIIVYFIVRGEYLNCLFAIPTFISFLALRPISMNLGIFFKSITWAGYILLLTYIFDFSNIWSLYSGLSIIVPWRINKLIYSICTNKVISKSLESEESFVFLFKYGVIGIKENEGNILWFDFLTRET